jgi:hypothetical protein
MRTLAFSIALILGALGCDVSTHCDPGQVYMSYSCYDVPEAGAGGAPGGADGASDGGASDGDPDGAANTCAPYEGFGVTCTMTSQCTCGADSCNTFTGNYCTHIHCLADPSSCPPGWTCTDVSAFDPATGSFCARP